MRTLCLWCDAPMTPKPGKEHCSDKCRSDYHIACRIYGHRAREGNMVSVETLRELRYGLSGPCTASEAVLEKERGCDG